MRRAEETIPVSVIGGFLGAGKTTYLNSLIKAERLPANSMILVNDFGRINIDAELIEYSDERIMRLSNGCICCTLGNSLTDQLCELTRSALQISQLYIEASGIADIGKICDLIRLSKQFTLTESLCLIDASQINKNHKSSTIGALWLAQIEAASVIELNRYVQADKDDLESKLRYLNRSAIIRFSDINWDNEVAATPFAQPPTAINFSRFITQSHNFNSSVCKTEIEALFKRYSSHLLRAKGIISVQASAQDQVLQYAGGRLSWTPYSTRVQRGRLVCIGPDSAAFSEFGQALKRL